MFQEARDKIQAAGITLIAAYAVDDPALMPQTVRQAVRSGAPMLIVGGGDGTLSGTVDEVVNTDCVFAVLPLATRRVRGAAR